MTTTKNAKMGPNDASGVVWALGECFFFPFMLFLLLTNVLPFFKGLTFEITEKKSGDNGIEPKRRQTCRLGLKRVFFSSFFFLKLTNDIL